MDNKVYTTYRNPVISKTKRMENRPPLLPLPTCYRPNESPNQSPDDIDLENIRLTLNRLVSHLKDRRERMMLMYASRIGQSSLLEWAPRCDKLTGCTIVDDGISSSQLRYDAAGLPFESPLPRKKYIYNAPLLPRNKLPPLPSKQYVYREPSFLSVFSPPCFRPTQYSTTVRNECTTQAQSLTDNLPRFRRYFEPPLKSHDSPPCLPINMGPLLNYTWLQDPEHFQTVSGHSCNSAVTIPPPPPRHLVTTKNTQPSTNRGGYSLQDGLANLSDYKLSAAEISLLKKGLSFVPTPLKITTLNHEKSLTETQK